MKNISWKTVMKYRNNIFGLSALWIVAFHIYYMIYAPSFGIAKDILRTGNMGVDVFLFLSAIGLSYSVEKNSIKNFYKNRFLRLIIPFFILSLPFYIWKDFFATDISSMTPLSFILDITTLSFWIKDYYELWYISFIVLMYCIFPYLYKLYKQNRYYILILIMVSVISELLAWQTKAYIYTNCEIAFSRIPIFLFGIFVSDFVKKDEEISFSCVVASLILFFVLFVVRSRVGMAILFTRYLYGAMAVSLVIVLGYLFNLLSTKKTLKPIIKISEFAGNISLEIYIIHALIIRVIKHYKLFEYDWYLYYIFVFSVTIITALVYKKLGKIKVFRKENQINLNV